MKSTVAFGAYEWANTTVNFLTGCRHACKYCYARAMAARFGTCRGKSWLTERVREQAVEKSYGLRDGAVMFPSSHDLHPDHISRIDAVLGSLLAAGNKVLIVTKPHLEVVRYLCKRFAPFADSILFRFSIGSPDTRCLRFWEPHAPTFRERMQCLRLAHARGFQTSVACEPILDDRTEELIDQTLPYVTDSVWVGKPNSLVQRLRANREDDRATLAKADELMSILTDDFVRRLYDSYRRNKAVKWKDSIKKVIGIPLSTVRGVDT